MPCGPGNARPLTATGRAMRTKTTSSMPAAPASPKQIETSKIITVAIGSMVSVPPASRSANAVQSHRQAQSRARARSRNGPDLSCATEEVIAPTRAAAFVLLACVAGPWICRRVIPNCLSWPEGARAGHVWPPRAAPSRGHPSFPAIRGRRSAPAPSVTGLPCPSPPASLPAVGPRVGNL